MNTFEKISQCRHSVIDRRNMLQKSITLIAGGVVLGGSMLYGSAAIASAGKVSQAQAGYKGSPRGGVRCDKCMQFEPPSGCKVVEGSVSATGSCNFFAARSN
jgi:hypothetical protein